VSVGALLRETDTGYRYIFNGRIWKRSISEYHNSNISGIDVPQEYSGLSSATKPIDVLFGAHYTETDTCKEFIWNGSSWIATTSTYHPQEVIGIDVPGLGLGDGHTFDHIHLTPASTVLGPEGTMFYCSDDNAIWVATE
jgi:hypothetical protein